jgi:hypothetical protein
VSQKIADRADAAEARTQETRGFMRQVRVAARHKYTPEEKVRIVLEGFRREVAVRGNILTITVDLTKEFGPSSSGTIIIASTEGNFPLPERTEVVGLNVYRKK